MREGWTYKKLGEVCEHKEQVLRAAKLFTPNEKIDYIDISSIDNRLNIISSTTPFVFCEAPSRAQQKVEKGDILISLVRPNLKNIAIIQSDDNKLVASSGFCVLRSHITINNRYIFYIVRGEKFTNYLIARVQGANYPAVREDDIKGFPIPVPPLSEQQRIVSELDLLSSIIEKKKAQLKEYDQLAQSIFYDMFGDPVTNEKGWEVKKLGEVCAQKTKIARASKSFTSNSPIEYIDISSIDNNSKTITTTTSYIFCDAPSRAQQIVEYGDILISLVRPNLQNIAIVLYNKDNLVGSSGFCVIRPKQQTIKEYLFYVIRSSYFTDYLMQRVSGANYPAVREEDVKSYTLPLPPLTLQQSFASKIEAIERQKALVQQSITEAETLFNSRMNFWFS